MAEVHDRHLDDLVERLARGAARRTPFEVTGRRRRRVPRAGPRQGAVRGGRDRRRRAADRLPTGARAAAGKAGAAGDGGRFHPHVTLARTGRPVEATRWLRVLDAYRGPTWRADEVALVASHLGEGPRRRPRYEVVGTFPLGRPPEPDGPVTETGETQCVTG